MNIQKASDSGWEMYLAKYWAKAEPSFKLNISNDASGPEEYLRTRVVGRLEVDLINLGYFLCCSSRTMTYLTTDLNPRYGILERNENLLADPDSNVVFYSNMSEKYTERPTGLQDVLYVDWADKYMLAGSGCECGKAGATKSIVQEYTQICMEDNGKRQWKTRRTEAIARWKFYVLNDDKEEEYCLPNLVLNVTLHKDTPMLSNENKSGTYMKECALI